MFMYQSEVCQLSYLAAFEHLVTLDIWGGSFYQDEFVELLEVRFGRGNAATVFLRAAKPADQWTINPSWTRRITVDTFV